MLENLDTLSAPLFEGAPHKCKFRSSYNPRTPMFNIALQRMREGDALKRLREERDADDARNEEAMKRLRALSAASNPAEKGPAALQVTLGRQAPERRMSGLARSA
jgi:hypothetical protein